MNTRRRNSTLYGAVLCLAFFVLAGRFSSAADKPENRLPSPNRFKVAGTKWVKKNCIKRIFYTCDNGSSFYYDFRITEPIGCNYHDDLGWVECFSRADQQLEKFDRMCGYR
jgi:hypothetical protein